MATRKPLVLGAGGVVQEMDTSADVLPRSFPITLDFSAGLEVKAGPYRVMGTASFPFTILSLDYEVGDAGGTFTAAVQVNGTPVTGLSAVAVSSATKANAVASGANAVAVGDRVSVVISGVSPAPPANAVLTLLCRT